MGSTLVFTHIPKCAGTSLQAVFRRQFHGKVLIEIGSSLGKTREAAFRERCRLGSVVCDGFTGHIPYGIHECFFGDVFYLTMLRDPVSRYVSQYHDALLKGSRCLTGQLRRDDLDGGALTALREKSVDDFLDSPFGEAFGNMQTRYLAGVSGDVNVTPSLFEKAKGNMSRMGCLGLVERFDESLLIMKQRFGWNSILYERVSPSSSKSRKILTENQQKRISQLNSYDLDLYAHGVALFEKQIEAYCGSLDADLMEFRALNMLHRDPFSMKSAIRLFWKTWMRF